MKKIINLNGTWKFTPMFDQRPKQNENYDLYRDERLSKKDWLDVKVPGVWQRYGEKFSIFEGVCWFYKEFELEELSSNLFAKLVFKGVDYEAKVYMNGQDVGIHESAYTEFSFNISNFLREGKNSIAVRVDNRPTTTKWPSDWGYGIYGGIHRDVFIELYDSDFIYDMKIQPDYNLDKNIGVINFAAEGNASEIQLKVNGETYYIPCIDNKYKEIVELENIIPWSPETPKLYKLEVVVNGQTYNEMNIGFRNINFKDRKILLNGKSVEIKGACYLCDSPKTGLAMDKEELRVDLMSMKDANVNAIRTHYPMSDSFYELCDELGFMVWIEPNVYCYRPSEEETDTLFKRKEYVDAAVDMIVEMIKGARQYASIIIYGIGNECNTKHPESIEFFETLSSTVRNEDDSRLVGYATLYGEVGKIAHTVDVMGINSYYGWYGSMDMYDITDERNGIKRIADVSGMHDDVIKTENQTGKDIPLLLTEFGADSIPGFVSEDSPFWSENFHAQIIEKYVEAAREHSSVAGGFVFAFTDYQDPSKILNGAWNGQNLKGMLSYDRKIKLPYYSLKKMYE